LTMGFEMKSARKEKKNGLSREKKKTHGIMRGRRNPR